MSRKESRENAFILLFEAEFRPDETALEIFEYAEQFREFKMDDYVKRVFFGVQERKKEIEELIDPNLIGWNKKRISPVSRAILALSTFEMLALDDVPAKVSINEAVELSKKYDEEKARAFINGVLNAIMKKLQSDGEDA